MPAGWHVQSMLDDPAMMTSDKWKRIGKCHREKTHPHGCVMEDSRLVSGSQQRVIERKLAHWVVLTCKLFPEPLRHVTGSGHWHPQQDAEAE